MRVGEIGKDWLWEEEGRKKSTEGNPAGFGETESGWLQQWPCAFIQQSSLRLYQGYHTGFSYLSPEGPWWEEWSASVPPITSTPQQILFPAGCSTIGPNGATIPPQQPCKCSPSAGYLQCLWLLLSQDTHATDGQLWQGFGGLARPLHYGSSANVDSACPELNSPSFTDCSPHKVLFPDLSSTDDTLQANSRLSVSLLD